MRSLADLTYVRALWIAVAALVVLLAALPLASRVFDEVEPFEISDPDSEVERADAAYSEATGQRPEAEVLVLVTPASGAATTDGRDRIAEAAEQLAAVEGVASVTTPEQSPELISDDRRAGLLLGFLEADKNRVEVGAAVADAIAGDPELTAGGVAVAADQIGEQTERDTRRIELFAAPVLLLLLLAVFRSPLAAALPLILAGFSIVVTLALLTLISGLTAIDLFSLQVVTGLGVGLAIDYSLFVLARYRAELRSGSGYELANRRTLQTAGRTVGFGALTVAAALAALIIFPNQFLSSTGIAGALVALLSGLAALVVLPAVLTLLGPRVDPSFESAGSAAAVPADPLSGGSRYWTGMSRRVMASPVPFATVALLVMLIIAAPGLSGGVTTPDARALPESESARVVSDAASGRFSELAPNQIPIVLPESASGGSIRSVSRGLARRGDINGFSRIETLPGGAKFLTAMSSTDPLSNSGQAVLGAVRTADWPAGRLVGGRAAELEDQRSSISSKAPLVVIVVVLTNLVLVAALARSLVLPLVSIALNTLTVLASYGLMVALFQSRTTAELLGAVEQPGIDISVPILAFAVVFGLSTDYGIFLFSRIGEARRQGLGESEAITEGLAKTGRLITSAAAIFAVAVGVNAFSDLVIIKEFAVAVAIAVVLDATVIRGVLVPAILKLLGARAWWWPGANGHARFRRSGADANAG